jgi:signal transduction histidine kinase
MQQTTKSHTINSHLEASSMIFGDRDRIGQVMNNMLSNPIKYSPNAKSINVTTIHKNNSVIFCLQDFGIGILKENKSHVFEPVLQGKRFS